MTSPLNALLKCLCFSLTMPFPLMSLSAYFSAGDSTPETCIYSNWSPWSACSSSTCDKGRRMRQRMLKAQLDPIMPCLHTQDFEPCMGPGCSEEGEQDDAGFQLSSAYKSLWGWRIERSLSMSVPARKVHGMRERQKNGGVRNKNVVQKSMHKKHRFFFSFSQLWAEHVINW